ncbi:MAG TPA: hypothetical protein VHI52_03510, partial [Verrucomicrobiae bacterium]|nr:hypothetical protein [Verrucomicrobiae bacterium]
MGWAIEAGKHRFHPRLDQQLAENLELSEGALSCPHGAEFGERCFKLQSAETFGFEFRADRLFWTCIG